MKAGSNPCHEGSGMASGGHVAKVSAFRYPKASEVDDFLQ